MNQQDFKYQLIAELLSTLEAEDFPIGVGKYLELQQLISKLPEEMTVAEMKTLLCPIFAKNKQDQEFFYELYDQSVNRVKATTWQPTDTPKEEKEPTADWWMRLAKILGSLLLLTLIGLAILRWQGDKVVKMPEPYRVLIEVEAGQKIEYSLSEFYNKKDSTGDILNEESKILYVSFLNGETFGSYPNFGNHQIDSLGHFSLQMADTIIQDSIIGKEIIVVAKYEIGIDTTIFEPYLTENQEVIYSDSQIVVNTQLDTLPLRPRPYPYQLTSLIAPQQPVWMTWMNEHKWWLKPLLAFLIMGLFGAMIIWLRERNAQIIADIQSKNNSPLLWNIEVPNVGKLSLNENYFKVLNLMRQRTSDDHFILNIPKTIDKTIEKGGIVDFQYVHKTRPPEYLMLIDRQSSKNHRAHLYDYLYETFKSNEVYIERFFYEGDIRMCWNENFPHGIKLHDLQQTFRNTRLIIIGNGVQLLNPISGRLAKWTRIFDSWTDKAILSPRPTSKWGGKEKQLEQKFILLPASIQSLNAMVAKMEAVDPDEIKTKITDDINEPIIFQGDLIKTLHHYFSIKKDGAIINVQMVKWIAACAIYPTLHWDLTMYLGKELSTEENDLMSVDNVIQLTRLPWFVEGKIPEQARLELLEYLPEETELKLRESLQYLFETIPMPADDSVAFSDARMNIALNDYLIKKNNLDKKEYEQYLQAGVDADVTMLKYLEGEKSPKDFEVDSKWKKYADGKAPATSYTPLQKALGFLAWVLVLMMLWYSPSFDGCQGELIEYNDMELCINDKRERLILREFQVRDYIDKSDYDESDKLYFDAIKEYIKVDDLNRWEKMKDEGALSQEDFDFLVNSLNEDMLPRDLEIENLLSDNGDTSILHFNKNIATIFYNQGITFYNRNINAQNSNSDTTGRASNQEAYCHYFDSSFFYDGQNDITSITEILQPIIERDCNNDSTTVTQPSLVKKIRGVILNNKTNKPLANVEVTMFTQKVKTNQRGVYILNVPTLPNIGGQRVTIKYAKEGFENSSKRYLVKDWEIKEGESVEEIELARITLKEKKKTTPPVVDGKACMDRYLAQAEKALITNDYRKAYQSILEAEKCNTSTTDKVLIQKKKAEIETYLKGNTTSPVQQIPNNKQNPATQQSIPTTKNLNLPDLEMVTIPAGSFEMGSNDGREYEKPVHTVNIKSFKMAKYEVTQRLYQKVMGENPSHFKDCDKCPVEKVSWDNAKLFIKKLNDLTGQKYRLPTEAEWEYAARGGEKYKYAGSDDLDEVGYYNGNSYRKIHPVGELIVNGYGLYDMSGNVWEWVEDCWISDYNNAPTNGRAWLKSDKGDFTRRGGSWSSVINDCRVSSRGRSSADSRSNRFGFRMAQD